VNNKTKTKESVIQGLWDGTEHLSHSSFGEFLKSPKHFIEYKLKEKKDTPAMAFGRLFHNMVLEPDTVDDLYAIAPNVDRRTKAGKAVWNDFILDNSEKSIVTHSDYETAERMKNAIYYNPSSRWVLDGIDKTEVGIEWEFKGFRWRGYIDGIGEEIILDLKTIADASPRKVERAILWEGYARQAAHYTKGGGFNRDYYIIAVDRSCNITVVNVRKTTIAAAWENIGYKVGSFKRCMINNDWNKSYDFWTDNGIYNV
jgi:hypothetical protein